MTEKLEKIFTAYNAWLDRQHLTDKTCMAYRLQVHQYRTYLAPVTSAADDPLHTPFICDYTVRNYKTYLKTECQAKPTSANLVLAAIDHFHQFVGNDRPHVHHESLPTQAPRTLKPEKQKALLRAIERTSSVRDKAIAHLLFYTALRLEECAALNLDNIRVFPRKRIVIIRSGKSDTYHEIPLNIEVRDLFINWLKEQKKRCLQTSDLAAFLNPKGKRLSARAIDLIICHLGADAHLELSYHVLRHTCLTNLVRCGNDLVLVAEIAGHKQLETMRRYILPSIADRQNAKEQSRVDF